MHVPGLVIASRVLYLYPLFQVTPWTSEGGKNITTMGHEWYLDSNMKSIIDMFDGEEMFVFCFFPSSPFIFHRFLSCWHLKCIYSWSYVTIYYGRVWGLRNPSFPNRKEAIILLALTSLHYKTLVWPKKSTWSQWKLISSYTGKSWLQFVSGKSYAKNIIYITDCEIWK